MYIYLTCIPAQEALEVHFFLESKYNRKVDSWSNNNKIIVDPNFWTKCSLLSPEMSFINTVSFVIAYDIWNTKLIFKMYLSQEFVIFLHSKGKKWSSQILSSVSNPEGPRTTKCYVNAKRFTMPEKAPFWPDFLDLKGKLN